MELLLICKTKKYDMHWLATGFRFYCDGFRGMTIGRTLWVIILVKLFVIFVLLGIFFFRPAMSHLSTHEKQDRVADELLQSKAGLMHVSSGQNHVIPIH